MSESIAAKLFAAIAHGDDDHRAWLKEAIEAFFAGDDVPAPRGLGNKEARIAELERRVGCKHEWQSVWNDYYSACSECSKCGLSHVSEFGERR